MKKDQRIKLKPGYILRKIANSDIVIPVGNNIASFNGLITLNETAAFLFKLISEGATVAELIEALTKKYDIDPDLAGDDVDDFVSQLEKADMLMICED